MIELRFIAENTLMSRVVCQYLWFDYSHVEIKLPGEGYLGAQPKDGVQIRDFNYTKPIREAFGYIEFGRLAEKQIIDYCRLQIGAPYDWAAIAGIGFHRDWRQEDKWICSELIARAVEISGNHMVNAIIRANRITPRDLALRPDITWDSKTYMMAPSF